MQSYPTPAGAAHLEQMHPGFIKLHPAPLPVHVFTAATDTEFHDHPFDFTTHIIAGGYVEEVLVLLPDGKYRIDTYERQPGTSHEVPAGTAHRITALPTGYCVTRAAYGPTVQKSGFYCLDGERVLFRYWDEPTLRPL